MNTGNLIPNTERSPEELREMGRKGGIKSGESRRKKRELQKLARVILADVNLNSLYNFILGGSHHDQ